jgi:VIT1/CCC1 family predicted Fe2+/Mn2+ transporter
LTTTTLSIKEVAIEASKDELTDCAVYKKLSEPRYEKNQKFREILSDLSKTEAGHFEFWIKYAPEKRDKIKAGTLALYYVVLLRFIFGVSFAVKYLEKREKKVIAKYKSVRHLIPEGDQAQFEKMIEDEEKHEAQFANQIQGGTVKYISFIVLGLADALVEIAGIHAGSLGLYKSTELTGLAGIIAGASASIAMASAAYAQAKQGFEGSASLSAFYTGISYFVSAVILATPYFFTKSMEFAIVSSLVAGVLIIAFVSYYNFVISEAGFKRNFFELAGIMLAATVALYILGYVVSEVFHIVA